MAAVRFAESKSESCMPLLTPLSSLLPHVGQLRAPFTTALLAGTGSDDAIKQGLANILGANRVAADTDNLAAAAHRQQEQQEQLERYAELQARTQAAQAAEERRAAEVVAEAEQRADAERAKHKCACYPPPPSYSHPTQPLAPQLSSHPTSDSPSPTPLPLSNIPFHSSPSLRPRAAADARKAKLDALKAKVAGSAARSNARKAAPSQGEPSTSRAVAIDQTEAEMQARLAELQAKLGQAGLGEVPNAAAPAEEGAPDAAAPTDEGGASGS